LSLAPCTKRECNSFPESGNELNSCIGKTTSTHSCKLHVICLQHQCITAPKHYSTHARPMNPTYSCMQAACNLPTTHMHVTYSIHARPMHPTSAHTCKLHASCLQHTCMLITAVSTQARPMHPTYNIHACYIYYSLHPCMLLTTQHPCKLPATAVHATHNTHASCLRTLCQLPTAPMPVDYNTYNTIPAC